MSAGTALVIIDVQRALFETTPPPVDVATVIQHINLLSARARAVGAPVIFVQHEKAASPLAFASEGWQLVSELAVQPGDLVVRKTTPDSFLRTELQDLLMARAIERLVICGYASEFCVDTTTRRAAALGYAVVLAADAHTTHDKPHANAAQIRAHENATLPNITSFGPRIEATLTADIAFV